MENSRGCKVKQSNVYVNEFGYETPYPMFPNSAFDNLIVSVLIAFIICFIAFVIIYGKSKSKWDEEDD